MTEIVRLAGEKIPLTVAKAFAEVEPVKIAHGLAVHNGQLSAGAIGALRKRAFITEGVYCPLDGEGCGRTVSFITDAGHTARAQFRKMQGSKP